MSVPTNSAALCQPGYPCHHICRIQELIAAKERELVTGSAGSGKISLIDRIQPHGIHIITLEDWNRPSQQEHCHRDQEIRTHRSGPMKARILSLGEMRDYDYRRDRIHAAHHRSSQYHRPDHVFPPKPQHQIAGRS